MQLKPESTTQKREQEETRMLKIRQSNLNCNKNKTGSMPNGEVLVLNTIPS